MMLKFIAIALFSQLIVGPVHAAIDYTTAFENLQNDVVWPAPSSNTGNISSTFGPRIRSSCNCDDFHRGVDIHGDIGDPVVATYDGKVVKKTTYSSEEKRSSSNMNLMTGLPSFQVLETRNAGTLSICI